MDKPIDKLLSRLDKVKTNGKHQYLACCPAHGDRTPSLSVKETPEGTILMHCFAGCAAVEIVQSVGLTLSDLFDGKDEYVPPRRRRYFNAYEALEALAVDVTTAHLIASDIYQTGECTAEQKQRLAAAARRIGNAKELTR